MKPSSQRAFQRVLGGAVAVLAAQAVLIGAVAAPARTAAPVPQPNAPAELSAVAVSVEEVALSWSPPANRSVIAYEIRRDGVHISSMPADALSLSDHDVAPSTAYVYTVEAKYRGRPVGASAQVSVMTPGMPERTDTTPPSEPEGLTATEVSAGVLLDWYNATDDSDITAYRIYRQHELLATVDGATLSYIDSAPIEDTAVVYSVIAMDPVANESEPATVETSTTSSALGGTSIDGLALNTGDALSASAASTSTQHFNPALRRYPYLTDLVGGNVAVNWATDRSNTKASVTYGEVGVEPCTARSVAATRASITVNSAPLYQWKAALTLTPGASYCYRVFLGGADLLGSDPAPKFKAQVPAGSTEPFSFAVIGDWGSVDSIGSNPEQAAVLRQIASSGARFALTTGDNSYPSGSHNNYGDLVATGPTLSAVFGPEFWTIAGASIPLFPAIGNHGFSSTSTFHPHLLTWPQDRAVTSSNGRYQRDTRCCLNDTKSASYPSAWYAFDAGNARFYVLQTAWADSNVGNATSYKNDYDYHWAPTTAQYQWLANDLATSQAPLKFAFFHYPLYSDSAHEQASPFLVGDASLEGLLSRYGVNLAFTGHAHLYQRNVLLHSGSLLTQVTGGGGAKLGPIGPCSAVDAFGIGWSYSANGGQGGGSSCGAAARPTSRDQVFHFLLVHVDGTRVTVTPVDAAGRNFDVLTYNFGPADPPPTTTTEPPPTTTTTEPPPTTTTTEPPPTTTTAPVPPAVFRDGFETGNLSLWTTSAGLVVQSNKAYSGAFAARGNTTVGNTFAKKTLPTTYTTGSARIYFDLANYSSQVNLLRLRTAADASLGYLFVNTSGRLAFRNDVNGTTATSTVSVTPGWHSLELRMVIGGSASTTEVWLDGIRVNDLSLTTNLGSTPIGRFQIGEVQAGRTYDVTFDDVVFDTAPIGP